MSASSYMVSCPACGTANRVPADKEGVRGRCGSCKSPLPPLYRFPRQLDERGFDRFVAGYPGPVLAEFWAPWCPHCNAFASTVKAAAEELAGRAAVVQIDTRENPALAARFGVTGIPVILLLKQGRVVDRLSGAQPLEAVLTWFRRLG